MKFSESWLREWVNPPVDTDTLVAQLTNAGLEVDAVTPVAAAAEGVVVGHVLSVEPHPDADKLRVCQVDVAGAEPLQIVCGAANVHVGMRAPTATVGAALPGGMKIKRAKLRGVESHGMLCSAVELALAESADGLMPLPADAPVGQPLAEFLALNDVAIDVDLTPNRGDCLSVAGIAREVGVLNRCPVTPPAFQAVAPVIDDEFPVDVEAPADCPRYVGRIIRDVDTSAPTPLWMQERLRRCGLRAISVIVDVTNYVLLELGQPMHAFDLNRLNGGIRVRRGLAGEGVDLLDGTHVDLLPDTLVIADEAGPLALAGIMGGAPSAVDEGTDRIFLESAYFSPEIVAGRARRYGKQTDSSHRFERGVDPALQRKAMERATELIVEIAGGRPGPVIERVSETELPQAVSIHLRADRIERLLGMKVPDERVEDTLKRLGMGIEPVAQGWRVVPPSFRFDIAIEADLIEELVRIIGYDQVPTVAPMGHLDLRPEPEERVPEQRLAEMLVARGYQEAITYSFVDPRLMEQIEPNEVPITLANPISADMSVMRSSLWPGLLNAVLYNQNRQQGRIRLFETGLRFLHRDDGVAQEATLAGVVAGPAMPEQWGLGKRHSDFFDLKGDLEALFALSGAEDEIDFVAETHPALHPGQSARVERTGDVVGRVGALHPQLMTTLGLEGPVVLFELALAPLQRALLPSFEPLSKFPAIRRDLAVIVDESVSARQVRDCIGQAASDMLKNLQLFDVYRGEHIDSGKKSLAVGLSLQAASRTLTDQEVDGIVDRVVTALEEELGGKLRG